MWWIIGFIICVLSIILLVKFMAVGCKSDYTQELIDELEKKYKDDDNLKNT